MNGRSTAESPPLDRDVPLSAGVKITGSRDGALLADTTVSACGDASYDLNGARGKGVSSENFEKQGREVIVRQGG